MCQGVTKVEPGPQPALLALVQSHDLGLDPASPFEDGDQGARLEGHYPLGVPLQARKEAGVPDLERVLVKGALVLAPVVSGIRAAA